MTESSQERERSVDQSGALLTGVQAPVRVTERAQEGTWTLTAPDGRTWTADSPLKACAAEHRERVPASVALARIFAAVDEDATAEERDAARYRWLRDEGSLTWVPFRSQWRMSAVHCDSTIDAEMARAPARISHVSEQDEE